MVTLSIPVVSPKAKKENRFRFDQVSFNSKGMSAVVKKQKVSGCGQYELPTYILNSTDNKLKQYPKINIAIESELSFVKTESPNIKLEIFTKNILAQNKNFPTLIP